jgi:polar amino acid transport system substrate-binding protein
VLAVIAGRKALWFGGLVLLLVNPLPCHAQPPLRIAFPSFPPFHWIDEQGKINGFFYEIIVEALDKRIGIATVWTVYPWPRCQENLKAGKDDAVLTVPTPERGVYTVTHKRPFYNKPLNVFTYADHPRLAEIKRISTLSDIQKGEFSIITYIGNGWHKEHVQPLGIRTYESPYLPNVWKMLASHRGDIVIEWPPGARPDISQLNLEDRIIDTGIMVASMPFHLLIRKGASQVDILDDFDAAISQMIADGTMQSILSRYKF